MFSKQKLEARRLGIGGSDVAGILNISPWKSAVDIYRDKIDSLHSYKELDICDPRYWGHAHEKQIIQAYEKVTGKIVKSVDTLYDKDHPFLFANIDGFTNDKIVVEAKTASSTKGWGDEGTDQIPHHYLTQVAHYSYITDCKYVDIPVLFFGNTFKIYRYNRNEKLEQAIKNKMIDFWGNHVQKGIPPDPSSLSDVNYLYAPEEKPVKANSDIEKIIDEIRNIALQIKDLKKRKDELELSVKTFMKEKSILLNDNGEQIVTWKGFNSNRFDLKSLKDQKPEIYNEFMKKTQSRKFYIK